MSSKYIFPIYILHSSGIDSLPAGREVLSASPAMFTLTFSWKNSDFGGSFMQPAALTGSPYANKARGFQPLPGLRCMSLVGVLFEEMNVLLQHQERYMIWCAAFSPAETGNCNNNYNYYNKHQSIIQSMVSLVTLILGNCWRTNVWQKIEGLKQVYLETVNIFH